MNTDRPTSSLPDHAKPVIVLRVPRLHAYDATSRDVLEQYKVFRSAGYEVFLVSRSKVTEQTDVPVISDADFLERYGSGTKSFSCINHFSGFDRGLFRFRKKFPGKFILRYHNVTPAWWFWRFSLKHSLYAFLGKLQIYWLLYFCKIDMIAAASHYSLLELLPILNARAIRHEVLPVFASVDSRFFEGLQFFEGRQSSELLHKFSSGVKTALIVGRVVPNKGLHHIPLLLKAWRDRTQDTLRIQVVGRIDPAFEGYKDQILSQARTFGVEHSIEFLGERADQDLSSCYQKADVFLSLSEHEGFCVPLVEAQAFGLPIVALDRGAVKETLGLGGLVISGYTDLYAQLVNAIWSLRDGGRRQELRALGYENRKRFTDEAVKIKLLSLIR